MARRLEVIAPAKVNLFLGVGAATDDGYHEVVTVMHALELADRVTVTPSDALAVTTEPDLGLDPADNLAWKAAVRLAGEFGFDPAVDIRVLKQIPDGAGLGGGSADAAATIAALCALHGVPTADPRVSGVAAAIGADVPFFLADPAALMAGRGDRLVKVLPAVRVPLALIKPDCGVPTAEAYREFDRSPAPASAPDALVASLERGELDVDALDNNLAGAAIALCPESGDALALATSSDGVLAAQVSGSGSTVFAVCASEEAALRLAAEARGRGWWGLATWTGREGVRVLGTESGR